MNHSRLVTCIGIGARTFLVLCVSYVVFMIMGGAGLVQSVHYDERSIPYAIAEGLLLSPGGLALVCLLISFWRAYFRYTNW